MRSHLNCDAVVSLWIWYLPIKQCVSFYRKTSGREMCVKGTKARCFSRVLLSFIHRKALEFAAVFCERYCQTTIFTQKKKCFLYLPKSRGGVWMWTAAVWESEFGRKKTLNFKKWLIGNLPERSIKIRTDRRVMNYQYSTRISNMANTSRAIASKINTQY